MTSIELAYLRNARNVLHQITGVRVGLVGDPEETLPMRDAGIHLLIGNDMLFWFRIYRHQTPDDTAYTITKHIEHFRALVRENLAQILAGDDASIVKIGFEGYADDPRALYTIPEVRDWMRKVFIEGVPQALALLDIETFALAQACCNRLMSIPFMADAAKPPTLPRFEITHEWDVACYLAGIEAHSAVYRAKRITLSMTGK